MDEITHPVKCLVLGFKRNILLIHSKVYLYVAWSAVALYLQTCDLLQNPAQPLVRATIDPRYWRGRRRRWYTPCLTPHSEWRWNRVTGVTGWRGDRVTREHGDSGNWVTWWQGWQGNRVTWWQGNRVTGVTGWHGDKGTWWLGNRATG